MYLALDFAIEDRPLDKVTMRALRLTCKRTKAAADSRVREFFMSSCAKQASEAVRRSGLLTNITRLQIELMPLHNGGQHFSVSSTFELLNLAVETCQSLKTLGVGISASPDVMTGCASILGSSRWACLEELVMLDTYSSPGLLSGVLTFWPSGKARPGILPALKFLQWVDPSASDVEALSNSGCLSSITSLSFSWSSDAYELNISPGVVAAMQNLLQKATSLEELDLTSSTFDFFDCENLAALKVLNLVASDSNSSEREEVKWAPALARPWKAVENLGIENACLTARDILRLFEAQDNLPVLKKLTFDNTIFEVEEDVAEDALTFIRRPHLELLSLAACSNSNEMLPVLSDLMYSDACHLPSLKEFQFFGDDEDPIEESREALSEFLSCPPLAALKALVIQHPHIVHDENALLHSIAQHCTELKHLNLAENRLSRQLVEMVQKLGAGGAWPQLEELVILKQDIAAGDSNDIDTDYPVEPLMDVEAIVRRVWPALKCL